MYTVSIRGLGNYYLQVAILFKRKEKTPYPDLKLVQVNLARVRRQSPLGVGATPDLKLPLLGFNPHLKLPLLGMPTDDYVGLCSKIIQIVFLKVRTSC